MAWKKEVRWSEIPGTAKDPITIVQLSDLHFDDTTSIEGSAKSDYLDALEHFLDDIGHIDLLAVTGDLVDNIKGRDERRASLKKSKKYLHRLARRVGIESPYERLIVLPGNHDYRWVGLKPDQQAQQDFIEEFREHMHHRLFPDEGLFIAAFDSNVAKESGEAARGWVDPKELDSIKEGLGRLEADVPNARELWADATKIALVHHHPLPIAKAEERSLAWWEKPFRRRLHGAAEFMLLKNAGTFLHHVLDEGYRLVLHGHLHRKGYWRPINEHGDRNRWLEIAGCKSCGKATDGSFGFNVIRIFRDRFLEIEPVEYTAARLANRASFPTASYEFVRANDWRPGFLFGSTSGPRFSCRSHSKEWGLKLPSGDLETLELIRGLRVSEGRLERLPFFLAAKALTSAQFEIADSFGHDGVREKTNVRSTSEGEILRVEHEVLFNPPLEKGSPDVNLLIRRRAQGLMFANRQDAKAFGEPVDSDECQHRIRMPTQQLTLRLRCESTHELRDLQVQAWDSDLERSDRELRSSHLITTSGTLHEPIIEGLHVISLDFAIYRPRKGFYYGFEWSLPDGASNPAEMVVRNQRTLLFGVDRSRIQSLLEGSMERVKALIQRIDPGLKLGGISGHLFGWTASGDLSLVGTTSESLVGFGPRWGRDLVGTAFRTGRILTFNRSRFQGHRNMLSRLPAHVELLIAVPVGRFGEDHARHGSVGALVLTSESRDSGLASLMQSGRSEAARELGAEISAMWKGETLAW